MAKKNENTELSDEVAKRQKERDDREKKEKDEQKKRDEEKLKKKKEREARIKRKEQKERKRINNIINYPFKTLFQISSLLGLFSFIFAYFWFEKVLLKSLLYTFFIFSFIFILVGVSLLVVYFNKAQEQLREQEQKRLQLIETEKIEEEKRIAAAAQLGKDLKNLGQLAANTNYDVGNLDDESNINTGHESDEEFGISDEVRILQNHLEDDFIERDLNRNFQDFETTMNNEEFFK